MRPATLDTALGGNQRLPNHLAAKDPSVAIVFARAAVDIVADELEVEAIEKTLLQGMHAPRGSTPSAPGRWRDTPILGLPIVGYDLGLDPTPS